MCDLNELSEKGLERKVRQLRVAVCEVDIGSTEEAVIHTQMDDVLAALAKARRESRANEQRGFYSGMTRKELAKSGTCEADWF